jgi:hypothetical protein
MRLPPITLLLAAAILHADPVPIFNGRDLTGWIHEGNRFTFEVRNQAIATSGRGFQPNWLHTDREYEDFRLTFEYRLAQWTEAAVYIRAPRLGRPGNAGIAISLAHDYHPAITAYTTGGIAGVLPPANPKAFPFNQWHQVEIHAAGPQLTVRIDGIEKQNTNLDEHPDLRDRPRRGFIGFPDYGYAYEIRNIRIDDRGGATPYVDLPTALDRWDRRGGGNWSSQNEIITGANGDGILYAPGEFENFELSALVRSHHHVNSGIFLRGSPDPQLPRGFEIQIFNVPDAVYPTGSIYNIARSRIAADYDGQWIHLQITVHGGLCRVRLNGDIVAETRELPDWAMGRGRIGLQIHSRDSSAEFRDLRVRPLK